mgnify:CR=1 FL=1
MAKDAKAQVEHANKEIKANAPKIEVVKKQKGTLVDKMQWWMLHEKMKPKEKLVCSMFEWLVEKGRPQEDSKNFEQRLSIRYSIYF